MTPSRGSQDRGRGEAVRPARGIALVKIVERLLQLYVLFQVFSLRYYSITLRYVADYITVYYILLLNITSHLKSSLP